MTKTVIVNRIKVLRHTLGARMSLLPCSYGELTELEKIPLRVDVAEILVLEDYLKDENLDKWLDECIEKEYYCAAEGIKRAKAWLAGRVMN